MLFHELGHLLLLCLWGKRITGLTLTPFGIGITTPTTTRLSYGKEISIVLAGSQRGIGQRHQSGDGAV